MFLRVWLTRFEGADDPAPAPAPEPTPDPPGKSFSQEQVNAMLAEDRRRHQTQTQKALDELEALRKKANLTSQERTELNERIETLQNEILTKEEIAARDKKKLETQYQKDLEDSKTELGTWKSRYTDSTIVTTITNACVLKDHKAINPQQVIAILKPNTRLVEDVDDEGKGNGFFTPMVKFSDTDKDGKPVMLDLPIKDAVKRMSEMDEFMNLFEGKGTGGLGGQNRPGIGKEQDIKELAADPKAWREARRSGKVTLQ